MDFWQPMNLNDTCPADTYFTACTSVGYIYLNLLASLFGDSKDRRKQEQINNDEKYKKVKELEDYSKKIEDEVYDFIVVGAGAAGCIVANRLTENRKWKVLLLEAGPEQPDVTLVPALSTALLGSDIDWGYETVPDGRTCLARPGKRCSWSRGKVMGGSTSINSMVYVRGNKRDFDGWAELGNPGWSYNEVLPFFKKSEKNLNIGKVSAKYHGVRGEQPISLFPYEDDPSKMMVDAFHEIGLTIADFNGEDQATTMIAQAITCNGKRVSTNNAFIEPIRYKRRNLIVKVLSEVFKILIDDKKIAYGVEYRTNGSVYKAYAKKEVILSGGTVNTPKMLMLSGIGPKSHLENMKIKVIQDLAVGENLHDHVTFNGITIALNKSSTLVDHDTILKEVKNYKEMKLKRGPLSGNGPVNALAFYKTDPKLPAPDIQVQIGHITYLEEYIRNVGMGDKLTIFPTSFYEALLPRAMILQPKSRGRLLLNESNPHGPPLLDPKYLDDPSDLPPLIKGFRYLLQLENTEAFKSRGAYFVKTPIEPCTQFKFDTDEYYTCLAYSFTSSTYHYVGSCKMGPKSDKFAVVDSELRVYGIERLRVIDASIMPFVVSGNTEAPSMMIGERGVDFIIRYWSTKLNQ